MKIGVLALQGAFREHISHFARCGIKAEPVRTKEQLRHLSALVIPGGESTTIGKLMAGHDLIEPIRRLSAAGMPVMGTCAGAILMAERITEGSQPLLGIMDIEVRRNAFGRQRESFEVDLVIPLVGADPMRAVFIRAPWIESLGPRAEELASFEGKIVAARQDSMLVTAFHPELTDDLRLHRFFVDQMVAASPRPV